MPLYMLHTDTVADLIHGKSRPLDSRIAATPPQELCISAITRGELLCGLSVRSQALSRVVEQFLARVACLPWDAAAASHFAMIAVTLHHRRTPLGTIDTMIAAHAIAAGAVLVSNREGRLSRVAGLTLEDWTAA